MADRASEDLSPSEFVRNIHALGKKKDAEDAKRIAELESQILIDRELRAQRRAGELFMLGHLCRIALSASIIGLRHADLLPLQSVPVLFRQKKVQLLPTRLVLSPIRPPIYPPLPTKTSTRR